MDFYNRYCCDENVNYNKNNNCNRDERKNCCIKRVEETYLCFPSYYKEEKEDCKKDDNNENFYPYYEGTFTLYPKRACNNVKHDDKHNWCDKDCDENKIEKRDNRCIRNKCCFCCGLFGHRW